MKRYLLLLTCLLSLAGALYSPAARADDEDGNGLTSTDTDFSRNTDDPQESPNDRRIPGQPTPGTADDPNFYRCSATAACN